MNTMKKIDRMHNSSLSVTEQKEFRQTAHFYYCLLIAVKMDRRYAPQKSGFSRKMFIQNWLDEAQKNKLFGKHLIDDIRWLKGEIDKGRECMEIESLIINAYDLYMHCMRKFTPG